MPRAVCTIGIEAVRFDTSRGSMLLVDIDS